MQHGCENKERVFIIITRVSTPLNCSDSGIIRVLQLLQSNLAELLSYTRCALYVFIYKTGVGSTSCRGVVEGRVRIKGTIYTVVIPVLSQVGTLIVPNLISEYLFQNIITTIYTPHASEKNRRKNTGIVLLRNSNARCNMAYL